MGLWVGDCVGSVGLSSELPRLSTRAVVRVDLGGGSIRQLATGHASRYTPRYRQAIGSVNSRSKRQACQLPGLGVGAILVPDLEFCARGEDTAGDIQRFSRTVGDERIVGSTRNKRPFLGAGSISGPDLCLRAADTAGTGDIQVLAGLGITDGVASIALPGELPYL